MSVTFRLQKLQLHVTCDDITLENKTQVCVAVTCLEVLK